VIKRILLTAKWALANPGHCRIHVTIVAKLEQRRLLALKFRRPLVEKRADSLAAVFRKITADLLLDLMIKSL
jgi:hypothetical protein